MFQNLITPCVRFCTRDVENFGNAFLELHRYLSCFVACNEVSPIIVTKSSIQPSLHRANTHFWYYRRYKVYKLLGIIISNKPKVYEFDEAKTDIIRHLKPLNGYGHVAKAIENGESESSYPPFDIKAFNIRIPL